MEIDAALAEELDGVVGEDVLVDVELAEVELPDARGGGGGGGAARGEVALLVGEGESQLDELEHVDVLLQRLVMEIVAVLEVSDGAEHDPGELRVHGDVRVIVNDLANQRELLLQIIVPYLPNLDRIGCPNNRRHSSLTDSPKSDSYSTRSVQFPINVKQMHIKTIRLHKKIENEIEKIEREKKGRGRNGI